VSLITYVLAGRNQRTLARARAIAAVFINVPSMTCSMQWPQHWTPTSSEPWAMLNQLWCRR